MKAENPEIITPCMLGPFSCQIISNEQVSNGIWAMEFEWAAAGGTRVAPGQFVDMLPGGGLGSGSAFTLRRPLSIADSADDGSSLTVIYRTVGAGTAAFAAQQPGEMVSVLGPLGHGFPLRHEVPPATSNILTGSSQLDACPAESITEPPEQALLIGGGVGIPPLYLLGRTLTSCGTKVQFRLGLRNAGEIFWAEKFAALGEVLWATDDGSAGVRGTVADLESEVEAKNFHPSVVHSCGPLPMLRYVKQRFEMQVPTFISVEERMACGTGSCYACVLPDAKHPDHQHRICYDGPVFPAKEVQL